ncbi:MAG: transcriptional regulator [Armatimonadetes bacterium]|nr:transcriptional regulator [Armatimonadota bacterium]
MQNVKRVEIITDALEMREVTRVLDAQGVSGYTIVQNVIGMGERGAQSGDDLTGVFQNSLLITACAPERVESLVEAIRPILARRGGVCLVSDAQWVIH